VNTIAEKTKAVNTVLYNKKEDRLEWANTDYNGFKNAFIEKLPHLEFKNKAFLILWAWWAAKAIIAWLCHESNNKITTINRTKEKAEKLKSIFEIETNSLEKIEEYINQSDIIINTTSCWLNGKNNLDIDWKKIKTKKIFYDIVYKPLKTKFLEDALENWHTIITGIGMLIHQAIPAFELFFHKKPKTDKELEGFLLN
jgi:shikimate dehydrogenase